MANPPKKIKDPTEAALSAIQDALNVRDTVVEPEPTPLPQATHADEPAASPPPWRTVRTSPPRNESREEPPAPPQPNDDLRHAANDDREAIGQILQSLQAARVSPK